METLYQKKGKISRLKKYYTPYLELVTKPSGKKLFMLLLSIQNKEKARIFELPCVLYK